MEIDMDAIIKRLRKEKAEAENNFYEVGRIDGREWAMSASYGDLYYAVSNRDYLSKMADPLSDEVLGDYFGDVIKEHQTPMSVVNDYRIRRPNKHFENWLRGWLESVEGFWREVEPELN